MEEPEPEPTETPQPAYRSPWAKYVGGASQTVEFYQQAGYRSFLWFGGAGGDKPDAIGDYADRCSMLAFWIGGARRGVRHPRLDVSDLTGGVPAAKHGKQPKEKERYWVNDDEEILDFIRLWTIWNDNE